MSCLLAIETATDVCSVALMQHGTVVAASTLVRPRAHAENLVPMIRDVLGYAGVPPERLEAVAVSKGPGSYTGLRIGVSTAKGLVVALGIRLVGVPSLEALAAQLVPVTAPGDLICTAFNARRDEVYVAAFRRAADGLTPAAETAALPVTALADWLPSPGAGRLWLAGEGAPAVAAALPPARREDLHLVDPACLVPDAGAVARLGRLRLERGQTEDPATFEPFYLKPFVARKAPRSAFERLPF
ncbi:tRNA (adenosine(37)-N6)-threonylcarbamoyltransferase complex dimerization subunit type 1 TsaB [Rhodocaloribacter litoris]|uniref:tRNA (adenosine(37)-N6)-threonylcarbamoyltransferase complex dimerization subunit type 1 TsaB n=1 Tax=Rhodocaloribacter litoris TaxID=2558931 RepID=UPI0014214E88|nr:tRNA (adenosine(37)-N6)-threonylcarbamoyltransferase complex dimerization subunit type 1 TsaB [Rhodocaloribacter litoris]QXD14362.1 tRNA (adenosine(37)-N6)-threonylcarbamoyltransferase complex dimerization subunit type 1 TsaB [Rhodocaloribacter litoris]